MIECRVYVRREINQPKISSEVELIVSVQGRIAVAEAGTAIANNNKQQKT